MKVGRSRVVLAGDESVECGLLLGASAQDEDEIRHDEIGPGAAEVVLGVGNGKSVARERDEVLVVDLLGDARKRSLGGGGLTERAASGDRDKREANQGGQTQNAHKGVLV